MSERGLRPLIVPVFIPNRACPHRCVFCDQERITSQFGQQITRKHVENVLDTAVRSRHFDPKRNPEVAFFGGTFTRLPSARIEEILGWVSPYMKKDLFRSIRVSTRPDVLHEDRLEIMRRLGVRTIELGVQSMDDHVLFLSKRGHTAKDSVKGVQTLKENGFRVGIQLMPGLPGDTEEIFRSTIGMVIGLRPDMVRLYPVLVIQGTELARLYVEGLYRPLGLDKAVEICKESCVRLEAEDIPVIRIGLMSSPSLLEDNQILAGPWHPAFGFLVRSDMYLDNIEGELPRPGEASEIRIRLPERELPLLRGHKNRGIRWIEGRTGARVVSVEPDDLIPPGKLRIEKL